MRNKQILVKEISTSLKNEIVKGQIIVTINYLFIEEPIDSNKYFGIKKYMSIHKIEGFIEDALIISQKLFDYHVGHDKEAEGFISHFKAIEIELMERMEYLAIRSMNIKEKLRNHKTPSFVPKSSSDD